MLKQPRIFIHQPPWIFGKARPYHFIQAIFLWPQIHDQKKLKRIFQIIIKNPLGIQERALIRLNHFKNTFSQYQYAELTIYDSNLKNTFSQYQYVDNHLWLQFAIGF